MTIAPVEKVPVSGGLKDLIPLMGSLSSLFGSGTTKSTSTSTQSADPAAIAQLDALINNVMGQNNEQLLQQMVDDILVRAKQEFAPILGQSVSSGARAYSDTTLKQLAGEAAARATAASASAKLNFINQNNQTAANLVNTKVNATKTQTTNSEQRTTASPAGKVLGYGTAALQLYALLKKHKDKLPAPIGDVIDFISGGSSSGLWNTGGATGAFDMGAGGIESVAARFGVGPNASTSSIGSGFEVESFVNEVAEFFGGGSGGLVDVAGTPMDLSSYFADTDIISGAAGAGGAGAGSVAVEGLGTLDLSSYLTAVDSGPGFAAAGGAEAGAGVLGSSSLAAMAPLALAVAFLAISEGTDKTSLPIMELGAYLGDTDVYNQGRNSLIKITPDSAFESLKPLFDLYGGEENYLQYADSILRDEYGTTLDDRVTQFQNAEYDPELIAATEQYLQYVDENPITRVRDPDSGTEFLPTADTGYISPVTRDYDSGDVFGSDPDFTRFFLQSEYAD